MKKSINLYAPLIALAISLLYHSFAVAQQAPIQFFRENSADGINVFETSKTDTIVFTGLKVRVGGNFTQNFQRIKHRNTATPVYDGAGVNTNQLKNITGGFNLAMANLNIDAQLADGIRMNMTMYLSSRHHAETWVKGGYIQFDKLPFLKSAAIDSIMKCFTIKVGHYDVDYGDQHFRRSDGGNAIYNPFIENYILDEFTTEIGGEIYFHPEKSGIIAMIGLTNGQLNPSVVSSSQIDSATGKLNQHTPALHGKIGYDKQLNDDLRIRLTGSFYWANSAANNTMFGGDRTGSNYFYVMENTTATSAANAFSGRYNPQFSDNVKTFMVNPFIKFNGLEFFGTYEVAQGRSIREKKLRGATQFAADLIYRFPENKENFWVGIRYNTLTTELPGNTTDVNIRRAAGSFGWFVTKNIMAKAEYVNQQYQDFEATDIRRGGNFNGFMLQASIGF